MKSIFNLTVSPSTKFFRETRPLVTIYAIQSHKLHILFQSPLFPADVRVQCFVPTLSTLLSNAAWQTLRHLDPVADSKLLDALYQNLVFILRPCPLFDDVTGVVEF